jgi:hypothetical protein
MSVKISNDPNGNRTHDLSGFIAVPQPTAPPRATLKIGAAISTGIQRYLSVNLQFLISRDDFNFYPFGKKLIF